MLIREPAVLSRTTEGVQPAKVRLQDVRVEIEVRDVAARVTLTQVFVNQEDHPIEAVYCFPVEEGAAVCGLKIETADRLLQAEATEKDKAFQTYDKAIQLGDAAFLLDQEREDILSLSVGNIKSGEKVTVHLTTVGELPVADGVARFQLPTTVSPRYAPADSDPVDVDRISPDISPAVPYQLTVSARALASSFQKISSPSHNVVTSRSGDWLTATLSGASLDRDLILEMEVAGDGKPVCYRSRHSNGEQAVLVRLYPDLSDRETTEPRTKGSEIIFVLDCSGSMDGSSIEEAKAALDLSLRALDQEDSFNIIRFGSTYELFRQKPVPYTTQSFQQAVSYLHEIRADLGGTELSEVMRYVCDLPRRAEGCRDLVLITDGEVTNTDDIVAMTRGARDHLRVFSFGIGYGASSHLVKGVARASGGAWEMIQPGEAVQPKVLRQFSRMSQPQLQDLRLSFDGVDVQLNRELPPLFEGDSYTVFGEVRGDVRGETPSVTLIAQTEGQSWSWEAPVLDLGEDDTVPTLWALGRIQTAKSEEGGGSNQHARRQRAAVSQITDLGKRFNLLTDYTSFVAVEERAVSEKTQGRPIYRRIPIMLTHDWGGATFGGSAGSFYGSARATRRVKRAGYGGPSGPIPATSRPAPGRRQNMIEEMWLGSGALPGELKLEKTPAISWYLKYLAVQQPDGHFDSLHLVAEFLGMPVSVICGLAARLDGMDGSTGERVLATWLTVRLLKNDSTAAATSGRALKKAERWLGKHEDLTIDGESLEELIAREYPDWGI